MSLDKTRIVVLHVDLDCYRCKKKIREVLAAYQEEWDIKTITYDEKNKKVTLKGPFNPEKLVDMLCCKACKVIRKWCIKKPEKIKVEETKQSEPEPEKSKEVDTKKSEPEPQKSKHREKEPEPSEPTKEPTNPTPELPTYYPYPCPYPYPHPYPYPLPSFCGGCEGKKPCSCGGCCCSCRPCACGCRGRCSVPYRPPTYVGPCPNFVCEESPDDGCILM